MTVLLVRCEFDRRLRKADVLFFAAGVVEQRPQRRVDQAFEPLSPAFGGRPLVVSLEGVEKDLLDQFRNDELRSEPSHRLRIALDPSPNAKTQRFLEDR